MHVGVKGHLSQRVLEYWMFPFISVYTINYCKLLSGILYSQLQFLSYVNLILNDSNSKYDFVVLITYFVNCVSG